MTILFIIIGLTAFILIVAGLSGSKYLIEREVIIEQPKQTVFDYIKYLRNQEQYNKWVMEDPKSKKTATGTDGTVGFIYAWDSSNKNVGKGEEKIMSIAEGERIDIEVRFEKPFKNVASLYMTTEALTQGQAKVKFGFVGTLTYGMKVIYMLFNLKKMLGKDMQTSLQNLKAALEQ